MTPLLAIAAITDKRGDAWGIFEGTVWSNGSVDDGLDSDRCRDVGMRLVADDFNVFVTEIVQVLHLGMQLERW